MSKKFDTAFELINLAVWLSFIGYTIYAVNYLFHFIYSLINPGIVKDWNLWIDLTDVYESNLGIYSLIMVLLIVGYGLKTYLFYTVTSIFKKLNFVKPFNQEIAPLLIRLCYLSFVIWILSVLSVITINIVGIEEFNLNDVIKRWQGDGSYLIMASIIYIMYLIFKRGVEIQNQNELPQ
jgi:hypothetical protein